MNHYKSYSIDNIPFYECPLCCTGEIQHNKDDYLARTTGESHSLRKTDKSDPSFVKGLLRIDLFCSNKECNEVGVMIMDGELDPPEEGSSTLHMSYAPAYILPAPSLFKLKNEYPNRINELMKQAFSLFWSDAASCGNKIRIAVEVLLDDQKIENTRKDKSGVYLLSKKGRPKSIMLQQRLDDFKKKSTKGKECAAALGSIKWLGNASSHDGVLIHQDIVFRALMIFSDVLDYLYTDTILPVSTDYSSKLINVFYHPHEQTTWPEK